VFSEVRNKLIVLTNHKMKKLKIVVILILGIGIQVNAQSEVYLRLGMTMAEISKEVPDGKTEKFGDSSVIVQEAEYCRIFYFMDIDSICILQVYTYHISMLATMLKTFNEDDQYLKMESLEYLYNNGKVVRKYEIIINKEKETMSLYVENM
jgi:hypothetical protein